MLAFVWPFGQKSAQPLVAEACRLNILDKGKPAAMWGRKTKGHRGAIRGGSLVAEGVDRSGPVQAGPVIPNQQLNDGEAA